MALDADAIQAAFSQPGNDGEFTGDFLKYLRMLSLRRQILMFAFAPKAAGTFLRTAAIAAIQGQLFRAAFAQGGRDAEPYLPIFIRYYYGLLGEKTLVTHVHMQALPANRHFIDALDLKPIVMLRPIRDMLASYWDMLETDDAALQDGLNCRFPQDFRSLPRERKADFLVDILGPWYASYFASWLEYEESDPGRVLILDYDAFRADPAGALEQVLAHADMPRTRQVCEAAMRGAWNERGELRFNRGVAGRGKDYFSDAHAARIANLLSYYPVLDDIAAKLAA